MKESIIATDAAATLSTHTGRHCEYCGREFVLAEPANVLAQHPVSIELACPSLHCPGAAVLTGEEIFESILPQLQDLAHNLEAQNDNAWFVTIAPPKDTKRPPLLH